MRKDRPGDEFNVHVNCSSSGQDSNALKLCGIHNATEPRTCMWRCCHCSCSCRSSLTYTCGKVYQIQAQPLASGIKFYARSYP